MAMDESEIVSRLIGFIYDAALDPGLWPSALQQIGEFVGGPAAALYSKDTVRKTGNVFYEFGVEPRFVQSYFDKYVKFDPFTTTRYFFPVEHVVSMKDIVPHEEYRQTTFFKEWAKPQGWSDFVSASLEKSTTTYAECGVFWHERDGVTTDEACSRMSLLIAHIRRAMLIGKVIETHKVEAAALADTLDAIAAANDSRRCRGAHRSRQCARCCNAGRGVSHPGRSAASSRRSMRRPINFYRMFS